MMLITHQRQLTRYVHPTLYTGRGFGSVFGRLFGGLASRVARTGLKSAIQAGSKIATKAARTGLATAIRSGTKVAKKVLTPSLKKIARQGLNQKSISSALSTVASKGLRVGKLDQLDVNN